ncbi:MAG: TonB family protein [Gammaproteobacteria bacterium]|nr:TonB family protein [Gammaproteobacteria bacterium]
MMMLKFFFPVSQQTHLLGNPQRMVLQAYVNESLANAANSSSKQTFKQISKLPSQQKSILTHKTQEKINTNKKIIHTKTSTTMSKGAEANTLLTLLHAAIQKQQHYPPSALAMERQGRATVSFTLFTDGSVQHIHLTQSSGTASLDEAALAAVREAAPFKEALRYLHNTQEYSIDVVFEGS